ncbi:MAG: putative toxin-antitoxin system toxin component, PIN family [Thermodesulfobacteriota bacterium]|nr:putative toxin-antitoxin system toxin component, PIN family [Thermodesulfobacteriota bacterium]
MIIVLDTNVLVSGLLTPFGSSGEIVRMVSSGKLTLAYDSRILVEYEEVLNRPRFQFDKDQIDLLIDYIRKNGQAVSAEPLTETLPHSDDAPFLEVAIEGKSEFLITGNKVHYAVKFRKGIKVLSPTEFIKSYQKIKDSTEHHV